MKRYAFLTILGLALGLLGPAAVLADQANPSTDGKPRHHQKFQEKLGLTDDQMTRIREVWQRQRAAARPVFQALRVANKQLRVNTLREISPLLTDEQRQKLAQLSPMDGHRHHRRPAQVPQG